MSADEFHEMPCTTNFLLKRREKAFQIAKANIKSAQIKQKETFDRKHQQSTYSIGSKVLLGNTAQKQRKRGKLESRWHGPYLVNRDLGMGLFVYVIIQISHGFTIVFLSGQGLYELTSASGKLLKQIANVRHLKTYHEIDQGDNVCPKEFQLTLTTLNLVNSNYLLKWILSLNLVT